MTVALERGVKHPADWDLDGSRNVKRAKHDHVPELQRPQFIQSQEHLPVQVAKQAVFRKRKAEQPPEEPQSPIKKPKIDFPHGKKRIRDENFLASYEPEIKKDRMEVVEDKFVEQDLEQLIDLFKKLLTKERCIFKSTSPREQISEIY